MSDTLNRIWCIITNLAMVQ